MEKKKNVLESEIQKLKSDIKKNFGR